MKLGKKNKTKTVVSVVVVLFTSLLPPSSDHVIIHLEGYNCAICLTEQLLSPQMGHRVI